MNKKIVLAAALVVPAVFDPVGNAGLHFEPKNSQDLADKVLRLLCDKKLKIELARKVYEEYLS